MAESTQSARSLPARRREFRTGNVSVLARVQNPNLVPTQDKDFRYIGELFQRATSIITGAECTAWGLLGGVAGYCVAHILALGLIGSGVGIPLGFIGAVALYTLLNPTQKQLLRCLERVKLTFASNLITKKEFETMREQCLKTHQ